MPLIQKDLQTGECQIEFELSEAEYAAMGRVTAQWAYLEHGVFALTKRIAELVHVPPPSDADSTSFSRRIAALRGLVLAHAPAAERARMDRLFSQIANAQQDRHKMSHAMWEWDAGNPERLKASSFRKGFEFEKRFDAAQLHRLAGTLARINFALEYPGGWSDVLEERMVGASDEDGAAVGWISREFAREVFRGRPPHRKKT